MSQINESAIKTPGVYVTEIPSFPPSIAQVATAIPVFVGYTAFATVNGQSAFMQAVEIQSLVQFTTYFGQAPANQTVTVTLDATTNNPTDITITPPYQLYNAVRLFFAHGGGTCFILSVGAYKTTGAAGVITDFMPAASATVFDIIQKVEDITLIVIPDAVILGRFDFNNLMTQSLQLCSTMENRFTIMDVYDGYEDRTFDNNDVITLFRNGVGGSNLNYAAAYYPWLNTSLPSSFGFSTITLEKSGATVALSSLVTGNPAVTQITNAAHDQSTFVTPFINAPNYYSVAPFNAAPYSAAGVGVPPVTAYGLLPAAAAKTDVKDRIDFINMVMTSFIGLNPFFTDKPSAYSTSIPVGSSLQEVHSSFIQPGSGASLSPIEQIMQQLVLIDISYPGGAVGAVTQNGYKAMTPSYLTGPVIAADPSIYGGTVDPAAAAYIQPALQSAFNGLMTLINSFVAAVANRVNGLELQVMGTSTLYTNIKNAITNAGVLVPPSGAIAGIYAAVDASRGVWKAPANVPLQYVIQPAVNIDAQMQEDLNIDTNAGKSVNAIRTFTGWGTLVWGARTLDGNSNDWRYVPVRRLFIMVEASVKNAAFSFVFEPNDSRTWTKVRAMIENYLTLLWKQGALAGAKPEQAFYVKVGLNQTMTFDDILNGRMIVEIGMAPVRPAEFIILRFTQIQQQS